jgi:hypothetical protein
MWIRTTAYSTHEADRIVDRLNTRRGSEQLKLSANTSSIDQSTVGPVHICHIHTICLTGLPLAAVACRWRPGGAALTLCAAGGVLGCCVHLSLVGPSSKHAEIGAESFGIVVCGLRLTCLTFEAWFGPALEPHLVRNRRFPEGSLQVFGTLLTQPSSGHGPWFPGRISAQKLDFRPGGIIA